jgi:hypothetical protein
MEDAVTFLESAKKVYYDVTLLLNKIHLLALDQDPNEPFGDQVHDVHVHIRGMGSRCGYLEGRG